MTRVALVTGANRGIGFAIAEGLVERGLDVIIGARSAEAGASAARRIGTRSVSIDVSRRDSVEAAMAELGEIDVLVSNAGVLGSGGLFDDTEDSETSMQVMVHGPYHLMRLCVPGMRRRGYGRVVNVSSGWGAFSDGIAGPGAYGVARAPWRENQRNVPGVGAHAQGRAARPKRARIRPFGWRRCPQTVPAEGSSAIEW